MHCALRRLVVRKTETEEMSVHPHSLASEHVQPTHQGLPVGVHSRIQRQWNLKRLQERNQILSVCYGYVQTERMALNGTRTNMKALRHIIGFQPLGVEPLFQRLGLPAMAECVAKPDASQWRHFVEAGTSAGFERKIWIGSNTNVQNVISLAKIVRDLGPDAPARRICSDSAAASANKDREPARRAVHRCIAS